MKLAFALCLLSSAAIAAPGSTHYVKMIETGECQRFDGVMIFPTDIKDPRSFCANMRGLWVPHTVAADEVPKPGFYPYN